MQRHLVLLKSLPLFWNTHMYTPLTILTATEVQIPKEEGDPSGLGTVENRHSTRLLEVSPRISSQTLSGVSWVLCLLSWPPAPEVEGSWSWWRCYAGIIEDNVSSCPQILPRWELNISLCSAVESNWRHIHCGIDLISLALRLNAFSVSYLCK